MSSSKNDVVRREQAPPRNQVSAAQLETARRLALETLEADHLALERETRLTPQFPA